jgi:hypothetical protein
MQASESNMLDEFPRSFLSTAKFVERAYRAWERLDADAIRMRSGDGTKELIEEVLPIAAFIKHLEVSFRQIRCKLANANKNHDATILISGEEVEDGFLKPSYYLEVTSAMSPTDYLEREALTRNGFVFGGGDIRRDVSKKSGDIVSNAAARDGTAAVENLSRWISERIAAKTAKDYPQPCILVVSVYPERRFNIHEWAEAVASVGCRIDSDPFDARYVVNWSTNTVFAL